MARDSRNVVNRKSVGAVNGGGSNSSRREAGDPRQTGKNPTGMGMDMGMGGAFGGAMHDAAAMGGGAMGEASYAGPLPESELAKKKKKQEAESSDMGNVGGIEDGFALSKNKAFGFGYEGEAKNTFTADGLAAINQHYAQAQAAKEMQ